MNINRRSFLKRLSLAMVLPAIPFELNALSKAMEPAVVVWDTPLTKCRTVTLSSSDDGLYAWRREALTQVKRLGPVRLADVRISAL